MKPFYSRGGIVLHLGDNRDVLPTLAERGVIITDAPYSKHTHSKSRAGARGARGQPLHNGKGKIGKAQLSRTVDFGFEHLSADLRRFCAREFARLGSRWTLVFSDIESAWLWRLSLTAAGLEYVRTGLWHKLAATPQFTGDRPAVACEAITICHPKGKKKWNGGGSHGLWAAPVVQHNRGESEPRLHPTQKPEELILKLVDLFTEPGELIYDPFAGSGTTGVCAARLGRRAVLVERLEEHAEKAAKRIDAELSNSTYHAAARGQRALFEGG
jgi:hypothetical protein